MARFNSGLSKLNLDKNRIFALLLLALTFLLMDLFIRLMAIGVKYHMFLIIIPNILFTALWIVVLVAVSVFMGTKLGRIFYLLAFVLYFILFLAHSVYYPYTGFFFSFNLLRSAEEGKAYIWDTVMNAGLWTFIKCFVIIGTATFAVIKFPKNERIFSNDRD